MEKTEVKLFHDYLNTISTSIKFTKELEKSGQLAFLDVSIQQMENEQIKEFHQITKTLKITDFPVTNVVLRST